MLDIFIAVGLGLLTLATAYLGVHVTLHGAEQIRQNFGTRQALLRVGLVRAS